MGEDQVQKGKLESMWGRIAKKRRGKKEDGTGESLGGTLSRCRNCREEEKEGIGEKGVNRMRVRAVGGADPASKREGRGRRMAKEERKKKTIRNDRSIEKRKSGEER